MIREEIESGGGISLQLDAAIVNPIMQPVNRYAQPLGHLRDRECARDVARVRLVAGDKAAMLALRLGLTSRRHRVFRLGILILLSKTHGLELTSTELS